MLAETRQLIDEVLKEYPVNNLNYEINYPNKPSFGQLSTNVALLLSQALKVNPFELAHELQTKLSQLSTIFEKIEIAGPGFINFYLTNDSLGRYLVTGNNLKPLKQTLLVEFSDPNPFKVLHIGHLYTSIIGDSLASIAELSYQRVYRLMYSGDIGRHVAITIYAMLQEWPEDLLKKLWTIDPEERLDWIAAKYVAGNKLLATSQEHKQAIAKLNKQLYEIIANDEHQSELAEVYWTCRQWSYDAFEKFYDYIGVHFNKYYYETQVTTVGLEAVNKHLEDHIFTKSDQAIIFEGQKYGLHTRVFVNSQGVPTYETKDLGLALTKDKDYKPHKSIILTGSEQVEYFKVVFQALVLIKPAIASYSQHLFHGMVRLPGNVKMSSRLGNIVTAYELINLTLQELEKAGYEPKLEIALAAIKYSFLKQRIGPDIVYNPAQAIQLQGNSGPYILYSLVRAKSILRKVDELQVMPVNDLDQSERTIVFMLAKFPDVLAELVQDFLPSSLCSYLYDLAKEFNLFYEKNRIIGDKRQAERIQIVLQFVKTVQDCLKLLGIKEVEKI